MKRAISGEMTPPLINRRGKKGKRNNKKGEKKKFVLRFLEG
jgi:hypothetical protein